ncbi:hypothetical protein AC630_17135 [Bradyrhizobium sp. AS23.2]|nr:hypothetical protein AC630_17135 [Bradyrhizobium sp. AS23.2]
MTLFATLPSFFVVWTLAAAPSAATARPRCYRQLGRRATLAMTQELCSRPLDADFTDADLSGGVHYRRPGVIRQGDAVPGAFGPGFPLGIARNQHLIAPGHLGGIRVAEHLGDGGLFSAILIGPFVHLASIEPIKRYAMTTVMRNDQVIMQICR